MGLPFSQLIKGEFDQLKTMQARNEGIERDVQRFKDRKKIEQEVSVLSWLSTSCAVPMFLMQIELLQVLIPVQEYRETRAKFIETKKLQRKLHDRVSRLKAKNAPAHALLKYLFFCLISCCLLTEPIDKPENWRPSTKTMTRLGMS